MAYPSARASRRIRLRWSLVNVIIMMVLLAGCNSSCSTTSTSSSSSTSSTSTSTTTTPPSGYVAPMPCVSPAPDSCRFWVRNVLAVAVALDAQSNDVGNLAALVPQTLNADFQLQLRPYRTREVPPVIPFTASATIFLTDPHPDDAGLLSDIDTINAKIASAKDETGKPTGFLPIQGSNDWIVGASPDWYGMPAQAGGDHVHGSPDKPPSPTGASTTAATPSAIPSGQGANVFVLDTGYHDPTQLPAAGMSPAFDNLKTTWSETDPIPVLATDAAVAPELIPPYEFDQEDPTVAAMSPAPPYAASNYRAVDMRDHGVAISELIHWIAPNAKITLLRVLNDDGVGDLQSLLLTLDYLMHTAPTGSVINLSLDYGPPVDCLDQFWQAAKAGASAAQTLAEHYGTVGCKNDTSDLLTNDPRYLTIGNAIEELIQVDKDTVVAAAGNSSTAPGAENANMPAAYCGVVSVGALTTPTGSLASFSNRPDSPCLALNATPHNHTGGTSYTVSMGSPVYVKALGVKVCSLHFQKILPYDATPPANGLALWSGTSFATALATGNIAAGSVTLPSSGTFTLPNQTTPC